MKEITADKLPQLDVLFEYVADGVYLIDPETSNIVWCNKAAHQDLGFERHEVLNHSVLSLQKDVVGMPQWQEIAEVIRNHSPYTFVGRHVHKSGGEISVEVVTTHFEFNDDDFFLSVARNVNKRVALEQEIISHHQSIWFALNEASDGIWEWEISNGKVFFSPQLKTMLGYGPDEMDPHITTWSENVHPDDRAHVIKILNEHIHGLRAKYDAEYRLKNRNGHYVWVHDRGKVYRRDDQGNPTHAVGMVQNITDQKFMQFQLEALAANDVLTNLPNRREGEKQARLQVALSKRNEQPLCLAIIDLDHFKSINDLFGHQKGDDVLVFVSDLFQKTLRSTDLIYRWGGEEFVIIFPNTTIEQARQISAKLHESFQGAQWENIGVTPMTFSMGISCFPCLEADFDVLIKNADTAAYLAKEQGRNQSVFAEKS
ncbi:sensor domain-containing diguanylate cyclase [Hydrogenovibrio marinus]|uniref:sensor domain-containing diguanylate cyclase n=1 Tax=Hydrogenovibrio marinus TaxID=28885 RepID=UPI00068AE537|nr:sensor domain-containing diguanylate cyclase [Hydrogenovibrio marinus]BBN60372.1 hypothetical protein HVMH_1966 [Hydrogenovibrio marinus]